MEKEVFKSIIGYEGLYEISNLGNVMSLKRGKPKLPSYYQGYKKIKLFKEKQWKTFNLHRLVAEAFIPNPENKNAVHHKNSIRHDNSVENLEWCLTLENNNYKKVAVIQKAYVKFTTADLDEMYLLYRNGVGLSKIGKLYKVKPRVTYTLLFYVQPNFLTGA